MRDVRSGLSERRNEGKALWDGSDPGRNTGGFRFVTGRTAFTREEEVTDEQV